MAADKEARLIKGGARGFRPGGGGLRRGGNSEGVRLGSVGRWRGRRSGKSPEAAVVLGSGPAAALWRVLEVGQHREGLSSGYRKEHREGGSGLDCRRRRGRRLVMGSGVCCRSGKSWGRWGSLEEGLGGREEEGGSGEMRAGWWRRRGGSVAVGGRGWRKIKCERERERLRERDEEGTAYFIF